MVKVYTILMILLLILGGTLLFPLGIFIAGRSYIDNWLSMLRPLFKNVKN